MSKTKKLTSITTKQITDRGVQSLANRPNSSAQYGVSGLSPTQLKLWFDKLATFLAEKINELQDTISADDAGAYIRILLDEYGIENLSDLAESFTSGSFAGDILQVYPSVSANRTFSLQTVINNIARTLSDANEEISSLQKEYGVTLDASLDTSTYKLTLRIFNKEGKCLDDCSIDMTVKSNGIADDAVVTAKIKDFCVTTAKLADGGVTTEKLADASVTSPKINSFAVTTDKIANEAVTQDKIAASAVTREKLYTGAVDETKLSTALLKRLLDLERDAFTDITYDTKKCILTFTTAKGKNFVVDLPLEVIVSEGGYDKASQNLLIVLSNGDEVEIPIDHITKKFIEYVDGIRESVCVLQKAPPIAAAASAMLLTTPTLAIVAGIT